MSKPRPKEYRPFRAAVYLTYIILVAALTSVAFLGVVRGLMEDARVEPAPRARLVTSEHPAPITPAEARACLEAFSMLRIQLDARFANVPGLIAVEGREALQLWHEELRVLDATRASIASECRVDVDGAGALAQALSPIDSALERLGRTYSGHATRMALEHGGAFRGVEEAFDGGRSTLSGAGASAR